ncbi:RNA-binding protein 43-like [Xenentodon cancila]
MAEPGRTVRVTGLPTDVQDERLKDKLFIHFLRSRNGGGEIDSVTIANETPVSALITFEDSIVAQRVIQLSQHILEVDEKKYKLTATQPRISLDPDQIILRLSATINCNHLPWGVTALTSLYERYPGVQITYHATEQICTLSGSYSNVQAVLAQLLDHHLKEPGSADNKESDRTASNGSRSVQTSQKHHTQVSDNTSRKPHREKEKKEKNYTGRTSTDYNLGSKRDLTPGGYGWEDGSNTDGGALQSPLTLVEDFTLIVDADMFQYLQKHCREEYQHILSRYNTEVVHETNQGLTTLFLKVAETAVMEQRQRHECLKLAREAISQLYQESELMIRRAQVSKSSLSPRGGLQRATENLSLKLPKLLLNEDEKYIYIIGSSSDVSEAKRLLLDYDKERDTWSDGGSLLRYPLYDSGSPSSPAHQEQVPYGVTSTVGPWNLEDEGRADGAKKYKLAARFKDSGMPALGSRFPTDFPFRANSSPSRQTGLGPLLGYDDPPDTAGISGDQIAVHFRLQGLVPP